jgi:hypothetical protein
MSAANSPTELTLLNGKKEWRHSDAILRVLSLFRRVPVPHRL